MGKKIPVLDTNIIIRFLTNDQPKQAAKVENLLKESTFKLFIPDIIIAEIVYVLLSFYELPKSEVIEKINILLDFDKIKINNKILKKTLEIFSEYNVSFADAYLCALNILGKCGYIYTFDRNLTRVKSAETKSP